MRVACYLEMDMTMLDLLWLVASEYLTRSNT